MREKYQTEIEKRISEFERDYAFTAVDFADIADTDPANKALSRLMAQGDGVTGPYEPVTPSPQAIIDVKRSVWRGEHTIIEYTVLAKGFASASQYYGVFYSVDDVPVSFQNSNVSLVPIADDVWEWKEAGDNRGLVKKIEDNWYYFEASF